MSAIDWVYANSKHKGNVRYVLVTLAIAYTEKGSCLSMKEIAKRTGISQATVRRALETLETDGTIQIIKNGGEKRGNGVTNCYRFPGYDKLHGGSSEVDTSHHETPHADTPAINAEPHTHVYGDAATRVKDLSLVQEQKTTTTAVVVVSDSHSSPDDDGLPLVEQAGELGDVARAYDKYMPGSMTSRKLDEFGVMIEDYGSAKVVEAFKAGFGKDDPWAYALWWLNHPELVDKPKPTAPSTQTVSAQQIADNRRYLEDLARQDSELYLGFGARR